MLRGSRGVFQPSRRGLVKLIMLGMTIVFAILAIAGLPVVFKGGWLYR